MARVKQSRTYDSRGRVEQARQTREAILDVARKELLESGYAATTIASIARLAGVSVETIYKAFGGKAGLVRAIYERGLAGRGPVPAPDRSDAIKAQEPDPHTLIRKLGVLASEVAPLVSPILLLVRAAAASDPQLSALLADDSAHRLERMRHNAKSIADRGFFREGVTVDKAGDLMWALTAPEFYELLVVRRGWTPEEYGELLATTMAAALLRPKKQT